MRAPANTLKQHPISLPEIFRARAVVRRYLGPTPLVRYEGLSRLIGAEVYVKHENHNLTGSFKIRGGVNLMSHLKQLDQPGVITFSTGNHGLSIATAARLFGMPAVVVVPENNNPAKNRAIREAGAELVESGRTFEESAHAVKELQQARGLYYAHPADEPLLIDGVGTEFLEIAEALPELDAVIVPLGAGSEAAAAITVFKAIRPDVQVIAVQAERSPAAHHSWLHQELRSERNETFAGGFATGRAYETPFRIYRDGLAQFVLLTEDEIYDAIAMAMFYTHNLAEGAGASTLMAAVKLQEFLAGKTVVLQMSGCNASPAEVAEAVSRDIFRSGWRQ
jgi:threonine dehydratase